MTPNDERILILAPSGQDGPLICEQLAAAGLGGVVCEDIDVLAGGILEGAATALIAEEAVAETGVERLLEVLSAQPAWSDFPITLLTTSEVYSSRSSSELLRKFADTANITLLERPLRVVTLLVTVQAAVRTRRRQYEFREYLHQYEQYQEQVRQTQKLESLGVLAGGIAHDFNNILTGILGNASLAAEMLPSNHPAGRLLEDVVAASERAAGLTSQMLAYAGKGQVLIRPVDLSSIVENLRDFFRASIPKRVELKLELGKDLPCIEGDKSQLEQVVMNLVMNAAEAIPDGRPGIVLVSTGEQELKQPLAAPGFQDGRLQPGSYATLQVSDDGAGMDESTLSRIFEPFFTTKFLGRGLGLAAVQGIVRGHRGGLRVESTPGRGTSFTIFFPVSANAALSPDSSSITPANGRATVLIVDDEEIVRRTAASMLEKHGYSAICAENGKAAVDLFRTLSDRIDVVLLDMTMPVMDGEEALREIHAIRPNTKVILSSGYNEAEVVRRFSGGSLAGFIQKPYTSTRLAQKIKHTLENSEARRTNHA